MDKLSIFIWMIIQHSFLYSKNIISYLSFFIKSNLYICNSLLCIVSSYIHLDNISRYMCICNKIHFILFLIIMLYVDYLISIALLYVLCVNCLYFYYFYILQLKMRLSVIYNFCFNKGIRGLSSENMKLRIMFFYKRYMLFI